METLMVDRVHSSLRLFMHRNAVFLCERLCAQFPSETNVQLLATCYLHNNQPYAAYHILKGKKMPESRYLFATSCFRMNLLREAEETLCPVNEPNMEVPSGATGHYLLGVIYRCTGRISAAAEQFTQALTLDPLLWAAYEELCILGIAEDTDECFSESTALRLQQEHTSTSTLVKSNFANENRVLSSRVSASLGDISPKQIKQLHANNIAEVSGYPHVRPTALHVQNSSTSNVAQFDTPSPTAAQTSSIMPPPLFRNVHAYQNTVSGDAPTKQKTNGVNQPLRRKNIDEARLKKVSGRLFNSDSIPRRSERLKDTATNSNSNTSQFGGNGAGHSSDNISGISSSVSATDGRSFEQDKAERILLQDSKLALGIRELLGLFRTLGEGFRLSCLFKCQEALEVYRKLPESQFNTGWVLCQVGKAYFELVDYLEADRYFELAHRLSPCTLDGMDIYSTVLYHLNEEMRLSYLAQELISIDRLSPQAWCAVGNCFALRKDHETALKNFQRSVQLDSRFAYAHTLCGHEYSALEDYENSIKFYRCALQVDERHYNAWYGLGVVYLRQEKFEFAEHHFRRAFQINPRSSVLMCYLGMALHSLKRDEEALEMMEKAIAADKKNPLPKYQKALILLGLMKYEEALDELERLKEIAPHESSMFALMGKIYKQLNILDKAVFCFGIALDLKPPAADLAIIKSAMEKVHLPDELMEDDL
ncbi:cell division cycle protein 27 homolog B isoform X5 [Sorghum bicolor]|uniref:cell division cycle protein 27 homolog B isoform X5 n=1 Tax=Sorghum bicolor TaxID=4558 RepID=UPI000B4248FA|nr:cell division cycle protein 27 homolog B isoform X5 [Sorghum bicolor]|eukprot:XP_021313203.1 cell division cycle protein 27 homolog B isoform X5 [Sorghum bicolor]